MRIALVNWARIEDGASHGGGVNGYCQAVGLELAHRGHEVVSLSSGTAYEPGIGRTGVGPCRIQRRPDWRGLALFEVVNSPVLAPSMAQFREPLAEVTSPDLERCVRAWLEELGPDVVHVHNIEGLSAGCVQAARECGARVIYSVHNYHTICPQVYLMQGHRRPCLSYDNGHACAGCIVAVDPAKERKRLADGGAAPTPPVAHPPTVPPAPWTTIDVPAWRPLLNVITPEPTSGKPPNDYATRRGAMIAMLNSCHRVLAVSEFVRCKFESLGVSPGVLKTVHVGSRMAELAVPHVRVPNGNSGLLRIAFVGYNNWFKGLPMLLDSLNLLTPEYLTRLDLTVLALNLSNSLPHLRHLEPRLAGLRTRDGYRYEDLPKALTGIDLGVVPSVWWDNAPQTVMEFHACGVPVLGANIGGIPEFVRDGENGLLFRGTDRWDLARRLAEVIRTPELVTRLTTGVRPPKTMGTHVAELEQEYRNRLS